MSLNLISLLIFSIIAIDFADKTKKYFMASLGPKEGENKLFSECHQ